MTHRVLKHGARAFVALVLIAIAGIAVAACGGDDGDGGSGGADDARALLEETFSGTKEVRSGTMRLALRFSEKGGETFVVDLKGPFESQGEDAYPKFDVTLDARLGKEGSFRAGLVSTSDRVFLEFDGNAYELPKEFLDEAREEESGRPTFEIPDLDAQSWVIDPEVVGQEEFGGVETDHIRGGVDVSALLDSVDRVLGEFPREELEAAAGGEVPDKIPARDRAEIERAVKRASVDIWTGRDDKTLRKLEVTLDLEPEPGRRGTGSLVLELTGLNEPQTIEAPKNVRPIDELLAGLGSLLGLGAGGATESLDDYQRCLEDAGADVAKAQRCAELLTR